MTLVEKLKAKIIESEVRRLAAENPSLIRAAIDDLVIRASQRFEVSELSLATGAKPGSDVDYNEMGTGQLDLKNWIDSHEKSHPHYFGAANTATKSGQNYDDIKDPEQRISAFNMANKPDGVA